MLLLSLILFLFNSIIIGFFGRALTKKGIIIQTTLIIFFSLLNWIQFNFKMTLYISFGTWIQIENWIQNWIFVIDPLSWNRVGLILIVSSFVHLYTFDYLWTDPHFNRFISILSLFTFFRLLLITSNSLLQLFIGWEGIGFRSYFLIQFWYTRIQAIKAATKARILNKIGDCGLLLARIIIFNYTHSLDFEIIFACIPFLLSQLIIISSFSIKTLNLVNMFLLLAIIGKSAQIGLHAWLIDAMEGPTPVSALLHAATMITAGIYLILRCNLLFIYTPVINYCICLIGIITICVTGLSAIYEWDLKKIIALSTCNNLGIMLILCGLTNYNMSLFHLLNHGFNKALLFLLAGIIIHKLNDEQDIRKRKYILTFMPITFSFRIFALWSLAGLPFFSIYFSKELVLELNVNSIYMSSTFIFWLLSILTLLTTLIYTNTIMQIFQKEFIYKINNFQYKNLKERSPYLQILLFRLLIRSLCFSYWFYEIFLGPGQKIFDNVFVITTKIIISELLPFYIRIIPIFTSLLFSLSIIYVYYNEPKFLTTHLLTDNLQNTFFNKNYKIFYNFYWNIEKGILINLYNILLTLYFQIFEKIIFSNTGHYTFYISIFIYYTLFISTLIFFINV